MKLSKTVSGLLVVTTLVFGFVLTSTYAAQAMTPPNNCMVTHRGVGPEESIPGFRGANSRGACGWEADGQFTGDNVCILNHDSTLDRTTTGKGRVKARSWSYVSRLHLRQHSWGRASQARVVTCQRYLELCRDTRVQICLLEAKLGATPDQVRSMVQDAIATMGPALPKFILETDTLRDTRIVGGEFPQVTVGFVGFNRWPSVTAVKASGAAGIIVNRQVMRFARVALATRAGLWVMPYSIETHRERRHVLRMGAHGAMTDSAGLLRRLRN